MTARIGVQMGSCRPALYNAQFELAAAGHKAAVVLTPVADPTGLAALILLASPAAQLKVKGWPQKLQAPTSHSHSPASSLAHFCPAGDHTLLKFTCVPNVGVHTIYYHSQVTLLCF